MAKLLSILLLVAAFSQAALAADVGAAKTVYRMGSSGLRPAFGSIDLSSSAAVGSSVLGAANGGTGTSALSSSHDLTNLGFSAAVSSNTLVLTLTQSDGATAPTSSAPAIVGFRSATTTSGAYQKISFTATAGLTLAAADSLGCTSGTACTLYLYLVQDTTSEVCASYTQFDERAVQSASALTGGADTDGTKLWCTSAHTSRPIRLVGKVTATWSNPNWGSIASPVSIATGNDANVASNSAGLERLERVTFGGNAGGSTACTSSPCTISRQSGNWVSSVTRTAQGLYAVNLNAGIFSSPMTCVCSGSQVSIGACIINSPPETTSLVDIQFVGGSSTNTDNVINLICMGPK
jgi:hypothetical protein